MISIDDFKKLEIKIGQILNAEKIEDADKLLKLLVDFGLKPQSGSPDPSLSSDLGERDIRQIISGISAFFPDPQVLVGKKCAFASNLEPRTIRGLESQGMILAVNGLKPQSGSSDQSSGSDLGENFFSLLETLPDVLPGSVVK